MTETTDTHECACPQCGFHRTARFSSGKFKKCPGCFANERRARDRVVAEKRRRAKGIAPVKGTSLQCCDCAATFVRNSIKAIRCQPCQKEVNAESARQASRDKAAAKGYRKIGSRVACMRCAQTFPMTAPGQKQCPACRALPDSKRWNVTREKARHNSRAWRARHPERVKEQEFEKRQRRKVNPAFTINERMSAGVRYSLVAGKQGSSWETLVGYTKDDLVAHLERQFLPGMSWDRREDFHIDHIVPLASFTFETADDPEFKAAWALSNLRPLWALDNIKKNDTRTHLL